MNSDPTFYWVVSILGYLVSVGLGVEGVWCFKIERQRALGVVYFLMGIWIAVLLTLAFVIPEWSR